MSQLTHFTSVLTRGGTFLGRIHIPYEFYNVETRIVELEGDKDRLEISVVEVNEGGRRGPYYEELPLGFNPGDKGKMTVVTKLRSLDGSTVIEYGETLSVSISTSTSEEETDSIQSVNVVEDLNRLEEVEEKLDVVQEEVSEEEVEEATQETVEETTEKELSLETEENLEDELTEGDVETQTENRESLQVVESVLQKKTEETVLTEEPTLKLVEKVDVDSFAQTEETAVLNEDEAIEEEPALTSQQQRLVEESYYRRTNVYHSDSRDDGLFHGVEDDEIDEEDQTSTTDY